MSVIKVITAGYNKRNIKSVQIEKKRWGADGEAFGTTQEVPSGEQTVTVLYSMLSQENQKLVRKKDISVDNYTLTVTLNGDAPELAWQEM